MAALSRDGKTSFDAPKARPAWANSLYAFLCMALLQVAVLLTLEAKGVQPLRVLFSSPSAVSARSVRRLSSDGLAGSLMSTASVDYVITDALHKLSAEASEEEESPGGDDDVHVDDDVSAEDGGHSDDGGHGDGGHGGDHGDHNGSHGDHGGHGEHHTHDTDALFFFFLAIMLGIAILHITMFKSWSWLQPTVVLFGLGFFWAVLHESTDSQVLIDFQGPLYRSYRMWLNIDAHTLLFAMLPPLLMGDAMSIDTNVVRSVWKQCVYLAGPGVLLGALGAAGLLWGLFGGDGTEDWTWPLCFLVGSILAATDPVAVVGLLKELGAPPALTVIIQGEALLNDGTAIVIFSILLDIVSGSTDYDSSSAIFLEGCRLVFGAMAIGMTTGLVFNYWIALAADRSNHSSTTIQVVLSIVCAYTSWLVSEGIFHTSGVLSTVCSALVLADLVWANVVHKETMKNVWHLVEFMMNSVLFFLAGALSGAVSVGESIRWIDIGYLFVIYIAIVFLRFILFYLSMTFLNLLSATNQVRVEEILVMSWGGLRGAVGLALAINVQKDRADGVIPPAVANRILFYIGGIACLTLVINATTSPAVVRWTGITRTTSVKLWLMKSTQRQLDYMLSADTQKHVDDVREKEEEFVRAKTTALEQGIQKVNPKHMSEVAESQMQKVGFQAQAYSKAVTKIVQGALQEISRDINREAVLSGLSGAYGGGAGEQGGDAVGQHKTHKTAAGLRMAASLHDSKRKGALKKRLLGKKRENFTVDAKDFLKKYGKAKAAALSANSLAAFPDDDGPNKKFMDEDEEEELMERLQAEVDSISQQTLEAMRGAYLNVVASQYEHGMAHDDMSSNRHIGMLLIESVTYARGQVSDRLGDMKYLMSKWSNQGGDSRSSPANRRMVTAMFGDEGGLAADGGEDMMSSRAVKAGGRASKEDAGLIKSMNLSFALQVAFMLLILLSCAWACYDLVVVDEERPPMWFLGVYVSFSILFTAQVLAALVRTGWKHWDALPNWVYFIVALVEWVMLVALILWVVEESEHPPIPRTVQLRRVTEALQFCRLVRITHFLDVFKAWRLTQKAGEFLVVPVKLVDTIGKIFALEAFITCSVKAQHDLTHSFGVEDTWEPGHNHPDSAEEVCVLLESQYNVYQAFALLAKEISKVDPKVRKQMRILQNAKAFFGDMSHFIHHAEHTGTITHKQAEKLIHPILEMEVAVAKVIHHPENLLTLQQNSDLSFMANLMEDNRGDSSDAIELSNAAHGVGASAAGEGEDGKQRYSLSTLPKQIGAELSEKPEDPKAKKEDGEANADSDLPTSTRV